MSVIDLVFSSEYLIQAGVPYSPPSFLISNNSWSIFYKVGQSHTLPSLSRRWYIEAECRSVSIAVTSWVTTMSHESWSFSRSATSLGRRRQRQIFKSNIQLIDFGRFGLFRSSAALSARRRNIGVVMPPNNMDRCAAIYVFFVRRMSCRHGVQWSHCHKYHVAIL